MTSRDEPEQSYYVSCRIRLILRLEDFGAPGTPEPPVRPATARSGKVDKADTKLRVVTRNNALLLVGPGDDPSALGSPQSQTGSADELTHVLDGIVPLSAQFLRNGLRTADTASFEIPYIELPVDPRVVRAVGVQLFMGTISAEDYQRGMEGQLRESSATISGIRVPFNVLPDTYTDPYGRPRTNLRFEGWIDDWTNDWPDADSPVVSFECTDNTRLLIDQNIAPKLTVSPDLPLNEAFADYLSNYPQFRGLSVEYRPSVQPGDIPVLKKVLQNTKYQPKLGPSAAGGGAGNKLKVWDYLTDVAGSVGHTVRFENSTLIIQRARSLYDARLSPREDDPFTGRSLPSGLELKRRLYVYGKNVQSLKFSRKFATVPSVNIEVRAYDTARKKTLVARFPLKDDRVKRLNPGESSDEKWIVKVVYGIKDEATLRIVAQGIYEQVTRNELGCRFVTKNLGSYGGGNLDPDALDALAGDPIDIRVLRDGDFGNSVQLTDLATTTRGADFLRELGFSDRFARAYQKAINNIGLQSTFRVKTMGAQFEGQSEGIVLDFELMNYIEVRSDKLLPSGEELSAAQAAAGSPVTVRVQDEGS